MLTQGLFVMTEKKISVIIPVYNIEKFLNKCIESVLAQTYKNLEIILVDDGSTDSSGIICDNFASLDNRIKVLHKTNGGLSSARNSGIEIASGEYVAFIDGDDYIEPNMIETLLNACANNEADLSICSFFMEDSEGKICAKSESLENNCYSNIEALELLALPRQDRYVVAWNKLYKKSLFDKIKFPLNKLYEDQATVHKVFWEAKKIVTLSDKLYHYIVREGSLSYKPNPLQYFDDLDALLARIDFYRQKGLENLIPDVEKVIFYLFGYYLNKTIQFSSLSKEVEETFFEYGQKFLELFQSCQTKKHYKRKEVKIRKKLYNLSHSVKFKIEFKHKLKRNILFKPIIKILKQF